MTEKQIRVLVVGRGQPERGGIATFMAELLEGGLADLVEFSFVNLTPGEDSDAGGAVSVTNIRRSLSDIRTLYANAAGADVVHIHSALAPAPTMLRAGLLACAAKARGAAVIMHAHGGRVVDLVESRGATALARLCLGPPVDRVVAVAESVTAALSPVTGSTTVTTIPNGVDCARFASSSGASHVPPRILYVGHLTTRKGVLDLLEASSILSSRGRVHELHIVGGRSDDGAAESDMVADALDGAPDHVVQHGPLSAQAMPAMYHDAEIFCLPSWWEAMPLSVLEAMASGLPVVASDVGAIDVMLGSNEERCGITVAPQDPDALANALEELLVDAEERTRLGECARNRATSSYDLRAAHESILRIYQELVDPS